MRSVATDVTRIRQPMLEPVPAADATECVGVTGAVPPRYPCEPVCLPVARLEDGAMWNW